MMHRKIIFYYIFIYFINQNVNSEFKKIFNIKINKYLINMNNLLNNFTHENNNLKINDNINHNINEKIKNKNSTILLKNLFHDKILSRKIRGAVFPQDGAILITFALVKGLIDGRPRGLAMTFEVDNYSPVPDEIERWLPTILLHHPDHAGIHHDDHPDDHLNEPEPVIEKQPELMTKPITTTSLEDSKENYMELKSHHFHFDDHSSKDFSWDSLPFDSNQYYSSSEYNDNSFTDNSNENYFKPQGSSFYDPAKEFMRKNYKKNNYNNYLKKNIFLSHSTNSWNKYNHRMNNNPKFSQYENNRHGNWWKYQQGHRERRHIFNHLEDLGSILGLNMKQCIYRAICEAKYYLMPHGVSLLQDVVRIVFTLPTEGHFDDDYSNTSKSEDRDCHETFKKDCSFSLIEFIINYKNF